jgi:enterochelin esterase-like enzyme
MIIVLPEGGQSYFVNHPSSGEWWADSVTDELVPEVDRYYRTMPSPRSRAVGGLSMGGMGALHLAFERPEVFGVVGAHSPTLRWDRPVDKWIFGDDEHFRSVNPLYTAQVLDGLESLTIWLDVGEEDWGWFTVDDLHGTLSWRGVRHEFHYLAGGHDPEYWVTHQWRYLDFYDRAFRLAQPA